MPRQEVGYELNQKLGTPRPCASQENDEIHEMICVHNVFRIECISAARAFQPAAV
eukprot:SAG31_NODE_525_length_14489_cov_3.693815_7_plen_55_part_00